MVKEFAPKIVGKRRGVRRSRPRAVSVPSEEELIAELKRKHGAKVVDKALKDQNTSIPLSHVGLLVSVDQVLARGRPRLAKSMKRDRSKDVKR